MKSSESKPLMIIDKWFTDNCDGLWEHHRGLKIETTDNPGWLMTIDETIDELLFNTIRAEVLIRWGAECVREEVPPEDYAVSLSPPPMQIMSIEKSRIKIYATSFNNCVSAAAHILNASRVEPSQT